MRLRLWRNLIKDAKGRNLPKTAVVNLWPFESQMVGELAATKISCPQSAVAVLISAEPKEEGARQYNNAGWIEVTIKVAASDIDAWDGGAEWLAKLGVKAVDMIGGMSEQDREALRGLIVKTGVASPTCWQVLAKKRFKGGMLVVGHWAMRDLNRVVLAVQKNGRTLVEHDLLRRQGAVIAPWSEFPAKRIDIVEGEWIVTSAAGAALRRGSLQRLIKDCKG